MTTLADVRDQIKAVAFSVDGTPTAKLIAVLEAAGITKTSDIAQVLHMTSRGVQKARVRRTVQ